QAQAGLRTMARAVLPLETSPSVIAAVAEAAMSNGWTDLTSALVSSLARPVKGPDSARPEFRALETLHPGVPVLQTAFICATAPAAPGGSGDAYLQARSSAWELLARLDPDGAQRAALIESPPRPGLDLAVLLDCLHDLRTVPITSAERDWLESLRSGSD